jgi:pilus assembly protein FimV
MPFKPRRQARAFKQGLAAWSLLLALSCGGVHAQSDAPGPTTNATNAKSATGTTAAAAPVTTMADASASADWPEVKPGQSALEFALEHAPADVTLEQFLLALMQQNPQAFSGGNRHLTGLRLQLPTAQQASSVPADQARAQLLALRATIAVHEAEGAPAARKAAFDEAAPPGATRTIPEMVWVVCVAALMVIGMLLFTRTRYEVRDRTSPSPKEHSDANDAARAKPLGEPIPPISPVPPIAPTEPLPGPPSRYRPALPPESEPIASQPTKAAAMGSTPGQRPLSERADLPSLDLEARATETPAPDIAALDIASPDRPAHLAARPAAPARPLDFSGIDLDLGSPQRDKP